MHHIPKLNFILFFIIKQKERPRKRVIENHATVKGLNLNLKIIYMKKDS